MMTHRDWVIVLNRARPGEEWSLSGDTLDGLVWRNGEAPTADELAPFVAEREQELLWEPVKTARNILLAESDWTQAADSPLSDAAKAAWADYRQALRDIPQDFDAPDDVVWPEAL